MQLTKRAFFKMTAASALVAVVAGPAAAEFSPVKPIDFVIMAGAGGGADQIARFIQSVAEKEKLTPRPLIPNNKGGGSGAEALIELKTSSDPQGCRDHHVRTVA
jgi:putative tricarboxylic transport membrane protein